MAHRRARRTDVRRRGLARGGKLLLTVGFLAVALGVVVNWLSPATGYEYSIYTATPSLFWGCLAVALGVSLALSLASRTPVVKWTALFLGGFGMLAVVTLPITRGYVFYGLSDSLTHLGWAAQIQSGTKSPFEFIYPGAHLASSVISTLTGQGLGWAMMLVVALTCVTYFVFVPLAVRAIVPKPVAIVVATFSSFLLLPLNNVATHNMFHPFSQTLLIVPMMLYLVFKHVNGAADDDGLPTAMAATSLLMPIVGVAMLLFHPQATLDVIIVLATAVGVQVAIARLRPSSRLSSQRIVFGQVLFLSVVFVAWIFQFWQTWAMASGLLESFIATVQGTAVLGKSVSQTQEAGEGIQVGLLELFIKLFLVSAVYCALAIALVVAKLFRWIESTPERDIAIAYFAASGVTLTPYILLHFVGNVSNYFFRHVGFVMVLMTILGAAAFGSTLDWGRKKGILGQSVRPVVAVVLVVAIVLSVAVAFPSPFIYKRGHGLSGQIANGYQTALQYEENGGESAPAWGSLNSATERYDEAYVLTDRVRDGSNVEPEHMDDLVAYYDRDYGAKAGDHVLPVPEVTVKHETRVKRSVGYSRADFANLQTQEGVHRVQSNEEFSLYYVETRFNRSNV